MCILFVGAFSCTDTEKQKQDLYYYYMQYARNYEVAAVDQDVKADYYSRLAEGFRNSSGNLTEEQYEQFLVLADTHKANAEKFRDAAEDYRNLAEHYQ
jgi:hypothetical protein